jgi:xylulokinase
LFAFRGGLRFHDGYAQQTAHRRFPAWLTRLGGGLILCGVKLLGIDVGSSSVKAAVLQNGKLRGRITRAFFETRFQGPRVEVSPAVLLQAISDAVGQLGKTAKNVDIIGLSVMSPAWCAMDARGHALTPIVTHQDRRSIDVSRQIERRVGAKRHLRLASNCPFPGSIASTTWTWYRSHEPQRLRNADLVGLLNTFLHRQLTGARVIDPSNASFTGLYSTLTQSGWSDELCDAIGVDEQLLPEVHEADVIGGCVTQNAGSRLGLTQGTPVLVGMIDTSAAMLLAGPRPGQLLDVCGSTDVLALCTDRPRPQERLLTRALGVNRKRWMSVSTLAAAGSSLHWARRQLFQELSDDQYRKLLHRLSRQKGLDNSVVFEPYLAGERSSMQQRTAAFRGLTLSTAREQMLQAMIDALARASADRLTLLAEVNQGLRIRREASVSGGIKDRLDEIFQRDWPGRWAFRKETEASLRGLALLNPKHRA